MQFVHLNVFNLSFLHWWLLFFENEKSLRVTFVCGLLYPIYKPPDVRPKFVGINSRLHLIVAYTSRRRPNSKQTLLLSTSYFSLYHPFLLSWLWLNHVRSSPYSSNHHPFKESNSHCEVKWNHVDQCELISVRQSQDTEWLGVGTITPRTARNNGAGHSKF